jgi:hypothetical protein
MPDLRIECTDGRFVVTLDGERIDPDDPRVRQFIERLPDPSASAGTTQSLEIHITDTTAIDMDELLDRAAQSMTSHVTSSQHVSVSTTSESRRSFFRRR